jgi:hypothetical protein
MVITVLNSPDIQPIQPIEPNLVEVTPPFQHEKTRTKRTIAKDVTEFVEPSKILKLFKLSKWYYKSDKAEELQCRDLAFACMLMLLSCRISELCALKREQIVVLNDDFLEVRDFKISKRKKHFKDRSVHDYYLQSTTNLSNYEKEIFLEDLYTKYPFDVKRTSINIPLPRRKGDLHKFTQYVEEYIDNYAPEKGRIFNIGRVRGWQIVNHITSTKKSIEDYNRTHEAHKLDNSIEVIKKDGVWAHWVRSMSLSYFVNTMKNNTKCAKLRGISASSTLDWYYKTEWKLDMEDYIRNTEVKPR